MKSNQKIIIAQKGSDILRKVAKEVPLEKINSAEIKDIVKKLKQVIFENEEAVAAAAPQIGKSSRVSVVSEYVFSNGGGKEKKKTDYGYLVFINPKIIKKSHEQKVLPESCLSAPDIYGRVKRAEKIKLEAYDESGKKFIKSGGGLFSQVIQHEIDHLDGVLFIDKALVLRKYEKPSN